MTVPQALIDRDPGLGPWCILSAYRGSIAHGMYEPSERETSVDDKDLIAIAVPPREHFFGCGDFPTAEEGHGPFFREYGNQGTVEIREDPWDVVIYEVRKAIWLMMVGNPTILSLLWLSPGMRVSTAPAGELLLANRDAFLGRHVYRSFVGYAKAQFVLMERGHYHGFMGAKRKALVDRFGYDPKSAAHLIRLLRMACEFLRDGELIVDRGGYDAAELLAIKRGEWTLDRVKDEASRLFGRAEEAYDRSTLPPRPDVERIRELCTLVVVRGLADGVS